MRTPRDIARALRWPEAKPSILPGIPLGRATPLPFPPKVVVWRSEPGVWLYTIGRRTGEYIQPLHPIGGAPSQPAALALGLAALDTTRSTR